MLTLLSAMEAERFNGEAGCYDTRPVAVDGEAQEEVMAVACVVRYGSSYQEDVNLNVDVRKLCDQLDNAVRLIIIVEDDFYSQAWFDIYKEGDFWVVSEDDAEKAVEWARRLKDSI